MIKKEMRTRIISEPAYRTTSGQMFDNAYNAKIAELFDYLSTGPHSKVGLNRDKALAVAQMLMDLNNELNKVHITSLAGWKHIIDILEYNDA